MTALCRHAFVPPCLSAFAPPRSRSPTKTKTWTPCVCRRPARVLSGARGGPLRAFQTADVLVDLVLGADQLQVEAEAVERFLRPLGRTAQTAIGDAALAHRRKATRSYTETALLRRLRPDETGFAANQPLA